MIDILEKIESTKETNIDINFNFKNQTEPLKSGLSDNLSNEVKVLLFCVNNEAFKRQSKTFDEEICGKSMKNWLLNAVEDFSVKQIEVDSKDDYFPIAKNNLDENFKYTLILFTDTPLLTHKTVIDIIEYFAIKNLSVLKFTRGFMFETDYLKRIDKIYNPQMQYFEEEDFITAYNLKQLAMITDIMRNRIISYHQKQGVLIKDVNSTLIDADVSIENDVVIYPNNKLLGNTIIESGAVISYNNVINNSVIMQNSIVENSTITQSIIGKNCSVKNYCVLLNKTIIGDQTQLLGYNYLDNKKIARGTILNPYEK